MNQSVQSKRIQSPSFYVFDSGGKPIASLKKSFCRPHELTLTEYKARTVSMSGKIWLLVVEDSYRAEAIETELAFAGHCLCMISFQEHTFGNFAVARVHRSLQQSLSKAEENKHAQV